MNLVTSLIGRKVKNEIHRGGAPSTIVAVFIKYNALHLVVENPEGGLYTMDHKAVCLLPDDLACRAEIPRSIPLNQGRAEDDTYEGHAG